MPLLELPMFFVGTTGADEVLSLSAFVNGGDDAVACAHQCAGAVHDLLQDGVHIKAGTDAQDRRA